MSEECCKKLLEAEGSKASEMTHWLSDLGNGSMSDGLSNLWQAGYDDGVKDGATLVCIAVSGVFVVVEGVRYFRRRRQRKKDAQAMKAAFSAGASDGRRSMAQDVDDINQ